MLFSVAEAVAVIAGRGGRQARSGSLAHVPWHCRAAFPAGQMPGLSCRKVTAVMILIERGEVVSAPIHRANP